MCHETEWTLLIFKKYPCPDRQVEVDHSAKYSLERRPLLGMQRFSRQSQRPATLVLARLTCRLGEFPARGELCRVQGPSDRGTSRPWVSVSEHRYQAARCVSPGSAVLSPVKHPPAPQGLRERTYTHPGADHLAMSVCQLAGLGPSSGGQCASRNTRC